MDIRFHNTLTHAVERFEPFDPPHVYMYNCGPTVYDFAHIGNFRAFVFADVLRRFLELVGFNVHQVMNLTDVGHMTEDQLADGGGEDKMQLAARRLKEAKKAGQAHALAVDDPDDPYQVADFYIAAFVADATRLGLKIAGEPQYMPRATQHVADMQTMIGQLIESGHAYIGGDGAVYYNVESFPQYGRLSGNTLDKLRGGAGGRVSAEHQQAKKHPADFLLWKPDKHHVMKWDSPWGTGYPGWHIECSAMATALHRRPVLDIHTGGEDNIFPHHECEIAQSVGATTTRELAHFGNFHGFSRYWLHTRFLLVNGEKMSKSKGNFFTVRDILGRGVDPAVLRYELMKAHYRSNMNFTDQGLADSAKAVARLRTLHGELRAKAGERRVTANATAPLVMRFCDALADDLNVAGALAAVFTWANELDLATADAPQALAQLEAIDSVLDVLRPQALTDAGDATGDDITATCRDLDAARAAKDFARADLLRKQLNDAGYDVKTTRDGTTATKRLA